MRRSCPVVAATVMLAFCGVATAVVYNPDGTYPLYDDPRDFRRNLEIRDWPGDVVASGTTPFEIRVYSEDAGRDLQFAGSLTQEVVRESETGYLSFHYTLDGQRVTQDTTDFEGLTLNGFGTYFTDIRADADFGQSLSLRRLNGGDMVFYWVDQFSHHVVVRTDAPAFDEGGSLYYRVDWDGWGEEGSARVATFRPVPEPAGLVMLSAAPLLLRGRRRRTAIVPPPSADR